MYLREKSFFGGFEIIRFRDAVGGNGFSLSPRRGACLLDLQLGGQPVLDGYADAGELERLDWGKSALLAPFPNRLKDGRYQVGGEEYQFPLNDAERGNALHGFVLDKPFEIEKIAVEADKASIELSYRYSGDLLYYPFPFTLRVGYSLAGPADFDIFMEMENTGEREIPAGMGWHPYFRPGTELDRAELQLPGADKIEVDERMIPTGEESPFLGFRNPRPIAGASFDTGFRLSGAPPVWEVSLRSGDLRLCYWQDRQFPFLQVFIPPSRQSIALEPMTCNIDAFHNGMGLQMLRPGAILAGRAGIRRL